MDNKKGLSNCYWTKKKWFWSKKHTFLSFYTLELNVIWNLHSVPTKSHVESGNFCSPQFDKINAKYQAKSFPSFFYPDFSLHYWLCLGVKVKVGGKNSERFPRFISIWPRFHLLCEDHSSTCFYVQTAVADDLSRFKHHSKSCCHSCFWFLGLMHL